MNIIKKIYKFLNQYIHLNFLSKLLLIASFVISFLTIFFFTYGSHIERKMITQNVDYIIDDMFNNISNTLGDTHKKYIYDKLNELKFEEMSEEDEAVKENNKKLFKMSIYILVGILGLCIISSAAISYYNNDNYLKIFSESLVLLFFVGLCEFIFLYFFGSKFISGNSNFIKGKIASFLYNPNASGDINVLVNMYASDLLNNSDIINDYVQNKLNEIDLSNPIIMNSLLTYINNNPEVATQILYAINNRPPNNSI